MKLSKLSLAISGLLISSVAIAEDQLKTITVNADLRQTSEQEMPTSVTVIDTTGIQNSGSTHLVDVLLTTPNVNFSGESSRARHIQIRGIGERSEYTGAPNSSIGLAIDGIDFSGIGMTGNLFDVKQVEILRGPQSARYGASALGGLINIQSNEPQKARENMVEATAGQDNLRTLGVMTTGAFSRADQAPQYRVAIQKNDDDGFRHDAYLNRHNTNQHNEFMARAQLRIFPSTQSQVDLTFLHADLNNGYDAWSLDNSFTTYSDQPGKDSQLSNAGAIKAQWFGNPDFEVKSTTALAQSDMENSYDGDWAYPGYWTNVDNITIFDNAYYYKNIKSRRTLSQDIQLTSKKKIMHNSTDWLFGLYGSILNEQNHTTDNYGTDTTSDYEMIKTAGYGQLDIHLNNQWTLTPSLRIEHHQTQYTNNTPENFSPNDTLWGGGLALSKKTSAQGQAYASISKGYKAGGFNAGLALAQSNLTYFKPESLINYELGHKAHYAQSKLKTSVSVFYMDRSNPQFDGYTYVGTNYVFYKENFDKATNYGLEGSLNWKPTAQLELFANLGLIKTDVSGTSASGAFTITNREQPHAPNYQYAFGAQYRGSSGFFVRADTQGLDAFYFSNSHTEKSTAYAVYNAKVGYEANDWEVYLWGKNLTDERYATRGFHFANEPTYSLEKTYIKLGDPRQFGITARAYF